jgi:hypothetical protein
MGCLDDAVLNIDDAACGENELERRISDAPLDESRRHSSHTPAR